jgi:effector-binding domain-containing protein
MTYRVQPVTVTPHPVAAARGRATCANLPATILALCDKAWAFVRSGGARSDGINVVIYWNDPATNLMKTPAGVPIEAGARVLAAFTPPPGADVVCTATPGGAAAMTTHVGPYDRLGDAHSAIHQWCKQNGRRPAGPNWEVYGHWDDDPAKLTTDVYYLLG